MNSFRPLCLAALALGALWPTGAWGLSVDQVLKLRQAGVGDATIGVMLDNELAAARQGASGRYEVGGAAGKGLIIYRAVSPQGQVDYPVEVVEAGAAMDQVGVALNAPRRAAKPATGGGLTLQLRSYRQEDEAREYMAVLAQKGVQAQTARVDLGERGVWHRVFVTGLADKAAAQALGASLQKQGLAESYWIGQ